MSSTSCEREPHTPEVLAVSAANAYHEAVEAMRWARQLISSGKAKPEHIAIASVSPGDYDDHFLALCRDANLNLHFVHGVSVTACRAGQAAAALADVLKRGLSQTRIRRLNTLLAASSRSDSGVARGLDGHTTGRCAFVLNRGVDAPNRQVNGR